jgi:hypothetical protein
MICAFVSTAVAWAQQAVLKTSCTVPCTVPPVKNTGDGARAALACQWLDQTKVKNVLAALGDYTVATESPKKAAEHALDELVKTDHSPEELYKAAQALPGFLKILAEANTRNTKAMTPGDKEKLFDLAQTLIDTIFDNGNGAGSIRQINAAFTQKPGYVALYQLLIAYPQGKGDETYVCNLETLRAAFEVNPDTLAKLVAEKVTGSQGAQE